MEVIYLTPEELLRVDPTGRGREFVQRMKKTAPTPVPDVFTVSDRDEWFAAYQQLRARIGVQTRSELTDWDCHYDSKYGPQGDGFALSEVKDVYRRSYELAGRPYHARLARIGRDYLRRRIRSKIELYGYPQLASREYNGKAAALPTMQHKGDFLAETVGFKGHRHVFPMLPGQRSQRNGHRVINQEANSNFRLWELELNACREWLKHHFPEYFSGWLNPNAYMNQMLTRHITAGDSWSVELDYTKCDEHTSFQLVSDIVLPLFEELLPSETVYVEFASYIEELFTQPLFLGSEMWTGLHNLFSGQGITQDVETYYDICLQLGVLCELGLLQDRVLQLAVGDDQTVVVHSKTSALAERVYDHMANEAVINGHEVSVEKRAIRHNAIAFCKRLYAPGVPHVYTDYGPMMRGMYPSVLTLNAIVNPEKFHKDRFQELVSILQRCDNLYGSPWFVPVTQFVGSRLKSQYRDANNIPETALELDWWDRVYGHRWHKSESETVRQWHKAKIFA